MKKTFVQLVEGAENERIKALLQGVLRTYRDAYEIGGARAGYEALVNAGHTPEQARNFIKTYEKVKNITPGQLHRDLKQVISRNRPA